MDNTKELYNLLKSHDIRLFNVTINENTTTFAHSKKTIEEWRKDMRQVLNELKINNDVDTEDLIHADICGRLQKFGYVYINLLVSDVYEGEIQIQSAEIIDYIDHDGQADGFGHYGFATSETAR